MSSILKALEKVEEAQSGRRSGGAGGFIKRRERRPPWVLPAGVLGGALVAALATFAAMGGFSRQGKQATVAAVATQAAPVAQAEPVQAAPVGKMVAAAQAKPVREVAASSLRPGESVPATAKGRVAVTVAATTKKAAQPAKTAAAVAKKQHKTEKSEKKSERRVARSEQHRSSESGPSRRQAEIVRVQIPAPPAVAAKAPAVVAAAPAPVAAVAHVAEKARPSIKVTGIAWQNDSASSVAMVNGRSVQQGSVVDGYKVERIFEDKVRFSGSQGKLEVPLGAGE